MAINHAYDAIKHMRKIWLKSLFLKENLQRR
jgi:hypothetical protein